MLRLIVSEFHRLIMPGGILGVMTASEYDRDGREESECVPEGVLKGIEDIAEGRTMSDEEFDSVLES